ncbi:MAG: hypothetical protein IPI05_05000 [Flavobacteriales bacterium]|nr:hypothetical protein [Flavobacteriales bacterium]
MNLLCVDADHYDRIWASKNGKQGLYLTEGLFAGPVIPRTDVRLFGEGINNKFHLSRATAWAQVGIFALFLDRVFPAYQCACGLHRSAKRAHHQPG